MRFRRWSTGWRTDARPKASLAPHRRTLRGPDARARCAPTPSTRSTRVLATSTSRKISNAVGEVGALGKGGGAGAREGAPRDRQAACGARAAQPRLPGFALGRARDLETARPGDQLSAAAFAAAGS